MTGETKIMIMLPDNTIKPMDLSEFMQMIGKLYQAPTESDVQEAYTIKEVMEILKLKSKKSIYNLRDKERLIGFGQGKGVRITGDSLRKYMKLKNK
jgi:hypothetical protein